MSAKQDGNVLSQLWEFINKYFKSMPRPVQVFVYLLIVVYFLVLSLHMFWPEVWDVILDQEQEIRGEIQGSDGTYLPVSAWLTEVNGEKLYVKKKKISDDRFYYEWILKATPKEFAQPIQFTVAEFYQDPANAEFKGSRYLFQAGFVPAQLKERNQKGRIVLLLDLDRQSLASEVRASDSSLAAGDGIGSLLFSQAFAQSKAPVKALAKDSATMLLRDFRKSNDPISDRDVRFLIPAAGNPVKIAVAESLKKAVTRGNRGATADYAAVLTEYDSLFIFTSAGVASSVFDDRFYAAAVVILHTGNDYESRRMAWFLAKLQDARSLPHVFREYSVAPTTRAKKLCLYVLEAFSANGDPNLKRKVKEWIGATQRRESSKELLQALTEALRKF